MAESALYGVANSILGQLRSPGLKNFFHQECSFNGVWSFGKDLERVAETTEIIMAFIVEAEQMQSRKPIVKLWLFRVREVLYEADDLLDAIAARALRKKVMDGRAFKKKVTLFFTKSNHLGFFKTVHAIKNIRERLDHIMDGMSNFQFLRNPIEQLNPVLERKRNPIKQLNPVLERKERRSFVNTDVIGRNQEKNDIIRLLLSEGDKQRNFEVISVIGFGGLGKTALAQLVFNDKNVQNSFDLCLWAYINYFFDLESVLEEILSSALLHRSEGLDQLQRSLKELIQGKKYLLVLDDVWDTSASRWSILETLLSCGKIGSKVLITTRKTRVATSLKAIKPFYRLGILSEDSAWSLFLHIVFKDGEFVGDPERDSVGKQIVRRCGNVPIIVTMVGIALRSGMKDKEEWSSFLEEEFAKIVEGAGGNMTQVLKTSYDDLPIQLKRCFAYCSIFPKDYTIEKDELICMWMAQGIIEPHDEMSLEEVGNEYFFHLVDDCFFQEVKKDESNFGGVKYTFKMHYFIRDLAIQVAEPTYLFTHDRDCRDMVEKSGTLYHIM